MSTGISKLDLDQSPTHWFNPMLQKQDLLDIARTSMPFGKYQGRLLIDLPEEYLLWFANKGFPQGRLGLLMALTLECKVNGLDDVINPLRNLR